MVQCGRQSFKGIFLSISTMYRSWFQAGGVVSGTDLSYFRSSLLRELASALRGKCPGM